MEEIPHGAEVKFFECVCVGGEDRQLLYVQLVQLLYDSRCDGEELMGFPPTCSQGSLDMVTRAGTEARADVEADKDREERHPSQHYWQVLRARQGGWRPSTSHPAEFCRAWTFFAPAQ